MTDMNEMIRTAARGRSPATAAVAERKRRAVPRGEPPTVETAVAAVVDAAEGMTPDEITAFRELLLDELDRIESETTGPGSTA